ncbi:MAG: hypothetical protein M3436_16595 [Pseudomonadota bacterium]|nr:hypothetical protein [Pseudomonadota bacterium]
MYKVLVRNNKTGEEREVSCEFDWDETNEFIWTEGNYACECNRALFIARAGGEDELEEAPEDHR